MKLGPFSYTKLTVALFRVSPGPPLGPAVQGELLRELYRDFPTLTQVPEGVLFSDPPKGRSLLIDRGKVELSEDSPASVAAAIDRMRDDARKTMPLVSFPPPYRMQLVGEGVIQAWEGLDPVAALKAYAPPKASWNGIVGQCNFAGVRFVFSTDDGDRRDMRIEPLFAQPDKFYVSVASASGAQGMPSLEAAMDHARKEADTIERFSDQVVADIACGTTGWQQYVRLVSHPGNQDPKGSIFFVPTYITTPFVSVYRSSVCIASSRPYPDCL